MDSDDYLGEESSEQSSNEHTMITGTSAENEKVPTIDCTHCGYCLPYCLKLKNTRNYPGRLLIEQ